MLKMTKPVEHIISAYKQLSKIPAVVGARINKQGNKVTSRWSARNLDRGKTTKSQYEYTLDKDLNVVAQSDFGVDVTNVLLSSVSPSEKYQAIIREERDKDGKKQFLEVWEGPRMLSSVDLAALELHGEVYADSEFSSLEWIPDESAVLYVAEKKVAKSEPYIKRKAIKEVPNPTLLGCGESSGKKVKGEEYLYRQDWGEQLVGKVCGALAVCYLQTETFAVLEGVPDDLCVGQVSFSSDGGSVVGVAWEAARKLGLIFCTNRPSYVFELTLDGKFKKLSAEGMSVHSPRVGPGRVTWLQRTSGGAHNACHSLVTRDSTGNVTTLIDIVHTSVKTANGRDFYGVYTAGLPQNCYRKAGDRLVFSSSQQNETKSYVVDLDKENARLVELNKPDMPGSFTILDMNNDVIVGLASNMTHPGQIFVATLPLKGLEDGIVWRPVSAPAEVPREVADCTVECLQMEHPDCSDAVKSFSAIYMAPKGDNLPLILWPHGGPHGNFTNTYSVEAALFAMLGFASLSINYRGSTGTGQASVDFLLSRVGSADVTDCKYATDQTVKKFNNDPKRLFLYGGSHGGFLVAHLSGQYPEVYKAVVARNPVIDVASMFSTSDIPDWCAEEAGFPFTEKGPVSEDQLLAMRRCSPIVHVHKVKAPTALMLGSVDKRVPFYQGLEYYRRLKANGVETRLYMYEDNHSLRTLPVEVDNLINGANWFVTHLDS
ncbi:acylamino-acid-releasing enzyme [Plutella xylostella]|uniref:acylamino-acid-releasing enzyme n=1 Tax=Plutella xylostella TaxID=51655 RepID=UPI00203276FB|nr:acylamino-acid-releasing enzyme [Plutella xylostella]